MIRNIIKNNTLTFTFLIISILSFFLSELSIKIFLNDIIEKFGRNLFLVLSLIIPILTGMGINFALTIGAISGQLSIIFIIAMNIKGIIGVFTAFLISLPISILFGIFIGIIMNKTKGKEMIISLIISYFFSGIYQIIILLIPISNPLISIDGNIKNTIDLSIIKYSLDKFPISIKLLGIKIPLFTLLLCLLLCLLIFYINKTKLGQQMKYIAFNIKIAEEKGIDVNKIRVIAITLSTTFAGFGQIISLQNIGNMSTFGSHEQISLYSSAAILMGGASIKKAHPINAIIGTLIFYTIFTISPRIATNIFSSPQIGEFFRVFVAYSTIVLSLYINNKKSNNN